jgi:hypothetical protein
MAIRKVAYGICVATLVASSAFAGAWGIGSFDNDDALDWLSELEAAASPAVLTAALSGIDAKAKYVEAPDCSIALASAEVVAAAHGRPSKTLPAEATAWLKRVRPSISPELLQQARTAVAFCRDHANSELRQLWADSKDFQGWLADTADLSSRLK